MAANENALTQSKFELGITGIIHNVFQGDYTKNNENCWKKFNYFPREGGGEPLHGKFHDIFLNPSLILPSERSELGVNQTFTGSLRSLLFTF